MLKQREIKIIDMFGLHPTNGEVGIEIEMEGRDLLPLYNDFWNTTGDGSLRGNGVEYVFNGPVTRSKVGATLDQLTKHLKEQGSKPDPSDRCGVHVHINCQKLTFQQTMQFVVLYYMLEQILVRYCGEDREGNLFCLRACDAEAVMLALVQCMKVGTFRPAQNTNYRYASLNLTALSKYGSLEFRSLRTPEDLQEINTWVNILLHLKDAALKYDSPKDIVEDCSMQGAERFMQINLQDLAEVLQCPDQDELLYKGIRLVQDVVYTKTQEPPRITRDEAHPRDNWLYMDPDLGRLLFPSNEALLEWVLIRANDTRIPLRSRAEAIRYLRGQGLDIRGNRI